MTDVKTTREIKDFYVSQIGERCFHKSQTQILHNRRSQGFEFGHHRLQTIPLTYYLLFRQIANFKISTFTRTSQKRLTRLHIKTFTVAHVLKY